LLQRRESSVFNRRPKTTSDGADVTSEGRPFQIRAPAIGNVPTTDYWSPVGWHQQLVGGCWAKSTSRRHIGNMGKSRGQVRMRITCHSWASTFMFHGLTYYSLSTVSANTI